MGGVWCCIILPVVFGSIIPKVIPQEYNTLIKDLSYFPYWFPCISVGALYGRYNLFQVMDERIKYFGLNNSFFMMAISIASFFGRYIFPSINIGSLNTFKGDIKLLFNMDIFYAPLFVFSLVRLINKIQASCFIRRVLINLGKKSMLMWFLHCIVFNDCRYLLQRIIFFSQNPIFVIIWALLFFYMIAELISIPLNIIYKAVN